MGNVRIDKLIYEKWIRNFLRCDKIQRFLKTKTSNKFSPKFFLYEVSFS